MAQKNEMAMTVQEVADSLGVCVPTAYGLVNRPGFPKIRVGRRILIPREAFIRWLNEEASGGVAS